MLSLEVYNFSMVGTEVQNATLLRVKKNLFFFFLTVKLHVNQ